MEIKVVERTPMPALIVKEQGLSMQEVPVKINAAYGQLMQKLTEAGKNIAGAPYVFYTNPSADFSTFDVEFGFPVAEKLAIDGLEAVETYGGKAVEATYKGDYSGIESAYGEMMKYIKDNSLEADNTAYEFYLNDPRDTKPEDLLTKIVMPIK